MDTKIKLIISLVILGMADAVVPVPILGIILIYVVLRRPAWFRDAVRRVYDD